MNKLVSCFLRGRSKLTVQIVKEAWVDALKYVLKYVLKMSWKRGKDKISRCPLTDKI